MSNILKFIVNYLKFANILPSIGGGSMPRVNFEGSSLEKFVQDKFLPNNIELDTEKYNEIVEQIFSYKGAQNNPPDLMLRNGDSFEIKKTKSMSGSIQLNSSFPKDYLYVDDTLINQYCRNAEDWTKKDLAYIFGIQPKIGVLDNLWIIYGDCYAADKAIYENLKFKMTEQINSVTYEGYSLSKTNELARVNKMDPLEITDFRVRGMWLIQAPWKVFSYINELRDQTSVKSYKLVCIIKKDKYHSFPLSDRQELENLQDNGLIILDKKIKNPNNPANLLDVKLFLY